eukprot:UN26622
MFGEQLRNKFYRTLVHAKLLQSNKRSGRKLVLGDNKHVNIPGKVSREDFDWNEKNDETVSCNPTDENGYFSDIFEFE